MFEGEDPIDESKQTYSLKWTGIVIYRNVDILESSPIMDQVELRLDEGEEVGGSREGHYHVQYKELSRSFRWGGRGWIHILNEIFLFQVLVVFY